MSRVLLDVSMSLHGFVAVPDGDLEMIGVTGSGQRTDLRFKASARRAVEGRVPDDNGRELS